MSCIQPSPPSCSLGPTCPSEDGCIPGVCPDFEIKRNDTRPAFKFQIKEENGDPMDLTGLVLEASMWANAKLKTAISATDTCFQLASNIGFNQILPDDIIIVAQVRSTEYMKAIGFDEINKFIQVERGVNGTTPSAWKKGQAIRIFRFSGSAGSTEMVYDDVLNIDGTTTCNKLIESYLVYEWQSNDTCVPGCFSFEFKLIKMESDIVIPSVIPICFSGIGVEWVRRYPNCSEFVIKICDSPTAEVVLATPSAVCPSTITTTSCVLTPV